MGRNCKMGYFHKYAQARKRLYSDTVKVHLRAFINANQGRIPTKAEFYQIENSVLDIIDRATETLAKNA